MQDILVIKLLTPTVKGAACDGDSAVVQPCPITASGDEVRVLNDCSQLGYT